MSILNQKSLTLIAVPFLIASLSCSVLQREQTPPRTGTVKTIEVDREPATETLVVRVGDEVRWINRTGSDVELHFPQADEVTMCQTNTDSSRLRKAWAKNETTIRPNGAASLCFKRAGEFRYTLRLQDAALAGREAIQYGHLRVLATGEAPPD